MTIEARPTADQLSPADRARLCNGVGPALGKSPLSWLAYALSWPALAVAGWLGILALYRPAGDDHDLHYAIGGTAPDKRVADGLFLARCLTVSASWPIPLRPLAWVISASFWAAVALGGRGSWRWLDVSPYPITDLAASLPQGDA